VYEQRIAHERRMIWTSNVALRKLEFYGDERLISRIIGQCREVIEISGEDQRVARQQAARPMSVMQPKSAGRKLQSNGLCGVSVALFDGVPNGTPEAKMVGMAGFEPATP
jgi:hypothetical protein